MHSGEVSSRLNRTRDQAGTEVSPAFQTDRVIVEGLPAAERPPVDRHLLESILGRPEDQEGSRRLLPDGVFQAGASPEEQARAFSDFQQAARKQQSGTLL